MSDTGAFITKPDSSLSSGTPLGTAIGTLQRLKVFGDDPWLCHGCGHLSHEVIVADSVAACVNHEDNTCCFCGL